MKNILIIIFLFFMVLNTQKMHKIKKSDEHICPFYTSFTYNDLEFKCFNNFIFDPDNNRYSLKDNIWMSDGEINTLSKIT
jgi:hypothetical protein